MTQHILCIDPGTEVSGVVSYDPSTHSVGSIMPAVNNWELADFLSSHARAYDHLAIELERKAKRESRRAREAA